MNPLKRVGRMRRLLVTTAAATAVLFGFAACSIHGGDIKTDNGKFTLGESTPTSHGFLVVLFRKTSGHNIGVSQILLDRYKAERKRAGVETATKRTLTFARGFCTGGFAGQCRKATAPGQWKDFHQALVDIAKRPGACLAALFRTGVNWTWRSRTDENCIPNHR